jgi:hypothetical protein
MMNSQGPIFEQAIQNDGHELHQPHRTSGYHRKINFYLMSFNLPPHKFFIDQRDEVDLKDRKMKIPPGNNGYL